jgi:hypothetical protein
MLSTEPYTATRDMSLYVTIASTTSGTHVSADLIGPLGRVDLGPNDTLGVALDGTTLVSARVTGFELDVPARSGDFGFALHHEGDHDVALDVTLVPPSNIRATSANGKLLLDWTAFPDAGAPTITVTGTCIEPVTIVTQTDTGHYELLASQLQVLPAPCAIALGLSRNLQTQIPFMGASFLYATVSQTESGDGTWTP